MLVHSLLIESVYLRRHGESAGGNDFFGDDFDGCPVASREKKLGPLTRKGTRDSTADPASGSVDHRNLVLEQHHLSYFCARGHSLSRKTIQRCKKDAGRAKGQVDFFIEQPRSRNHHSAGTLLRSLCTSQLPEQARLPGDDIGIFFGKEQLGVMNSPNSGDPRQDSGEIVRIAT